MLSITKETEKTVPTKIKYLVETLSKKINWYIVMFLLGGLTQAIITLILK